jgi:glutaredoxin 3
MQNLINIQVYGKPQCPVCDQARAALESRGLDYSYTEIDVGQRTSKPTIARQEFLDKFPGVRSVPQIVIDGQHIGGYPELLKHLGGA